MTDRNYMLPRENEKNRLITVDVIESILHNYGLDIRVNDIRNYQLAFIHRSYLKNSKITEEHNNNCVPLQEECNESIEFLGDSVLDAVVGIYLYDRYSDKSEGFLTKTKTKLVRGKTLAKLADKLGFGEWIVISRHVESEDGRNNYRLLEDLFECFIAAIYLDNGGSPLSSAWLQSLSRWRVLEGSIGTNSSPSELTEFISLSKELVNGKTNGYLFCQKFIINIFERNIDIVKLISHDDNYKDQLQHYFQRTYKGIFPEWELLSVEGPTNNRWHTIGIRNDNGYLIGQGKEKKKVDAEQLASKTALINLGAITDEDEDYFYAKN